MLVYETSKTPTESLFRVAMNKLKANKEVSCK